MSTALGFLYAGENYGGHEEELTSEDSSDLTNHFPDGVKSIIIYTSENATKWQVFTEKNWHGATVMLREGRRYATLDAMGLGNPVKSVRKFAAGQNTAAVKLYEDEEYGGATFELQDDSPELTTTISKGVKSVILGENAEKWQVFTQVSYQGANTILMPGRHYTSLDAIGLGNPVQSMKRFSAGGHDDHMDAKTGESEQ